MTPEAERPAGPRYVARRLDDVPTRFGGVVKLVRAELGLRAFGVQVFDYPPGGRGPLHDESASGQEELYLGLDGGGWLEIDDERVPIGPRVAVAVPAGVPRRAVAGGGGLSLLCVGGVPGAPYAPFPKFDA